MGGDTINKEQKEVQQAFLDSEKEVLERLKKNYQDALNDINKKIELLMARQDADMQHVIYQVEYQKALKKQVQSILEQLQANEFETVSEYLTQSYTNGYIGTMYDIAGQGIPLILPIDQEQVVAAIMNETRLSTTLYDAFDIKDLQRKISGEISRGISTGMMYSDIARNISNYANISRNNAMRIARTEGHRIQCKAASDAQWKAKSRGADIIKQWDATLDSKTRASHRKVDGELRELGESRKDEEPFSNGLMFPGDPKGDASEVINCRCALLQRARWALDEEELETLKKRAEYFGLDKTDNFADYKKKYLKASERVRLSPQKTNNEDTLENIGKSSKIKTKASITMNLQTFAHKTKHGSERAGQRNVKDTEIDDAIQNPLHTSEVLTDEKGRKSKKYIGKDATVVVNPDTKEVVTTWKTGSRTKKKYGKDD